LTELIKSINKIKEIINDKYNIIITIMWLSDHRYRQLQLFFSDTADQKHLIMAEKNNNKKQLMTLTVNISEIIEY